MFLRNVLEINFNILTFNIMDFRQYKTSFYSYSVSRIVFKKRNKVILSILYLFDGVVIAAQCTATF